MLSQLDLIAGLKKNNPNAIRQMVDEYTDYVYSLSLKTLRNVADAEEVVNDVLMKVIQKINDLNEGTSIKSWIYAITYRSCIDKIRARKTFDEINQNHESISHDDLNARMEAKENQLVVEKLLSYLAPDDALLMRLYYLEECKIKEVSEITGLNEENIKTRLFRARKLLSQKTSLQT
ncbi:MAG TPA: sigma-70 family RNA polymerase sigma factor [Saprospiraceae bacterium]|nr:sigma-70 family RNA polymerase sigma factor [Saprospiraceae bacterium]HPN70630.1 sigma-70 family RNA polymerase sigma factor [Saprospiraceae bacterium]